jgi:hypothetical protein
MSVPSVSLPGGLAARVGSLVTATVKGRTYCQGRHGIMDLRALGHHFLVHQLQRLSVEHPEAVSGGLVDTLRLREVLPEGEGIRLAFRVLRDLLELPPGPSYQQG